MRHNFYPFLASQNYLSFKFESNCDGRKISKVVEYVEVEEQIYNLAFGDIDENGELDDLSVSANRDMEKVLATVVQTIFVFFEMNPETTLFFQGSTPARTRLYQIVITKAKANWAEDFVIHGICDEQVEPFESNKPYTAFLIN